MENINGKVKLIISNTIVEWNNQFWEVLDIDYYDIDCYKAVPLNSKTTKYFLIPISETRIVDEIAHKWISWFESSYLMEDWCSEIFNNGEK